MGICYAKLSEGPTMSFPSGWGLNFDWVTATLLLQIWCCAWDHCPIACPSVSQALAVSQMVSRLNLEYFHIQKSSWWTQMTAKRPGAVAANSPNNHPSTPVLDSMHEVYELFELICCVWFSPNVQTSTLCSQRTLFQQSCVLSQMLLYKPNLVFDYHSTLLLLTVVIPTEAVRCT